MFSSSAVRIGYVEAIRIGYVGAKFHNFSSVALRFKSRSLMSCTDKETGIASLFTCGKCYMLVRYKFSPKLKFEMSLYSDRLHLINVITC